MATLQAVATGLFTAAGTWLVGDATSLNDSQAANTALTTSYQNSSAFTPGAITVDGIAIWIASRAAGSPSNTISVRLAVAGVTVTGTETTMNVSDIDECTTALGNGGWYYFKFNVAGTPTPVLLLAATAYTVGIKLSATTTAVSCYSSATTNWARNVVTTTSAAPASGDRLHIGADHLAAGTTNNYVVTMDNTATTSFGSVATQSLAINKGGTLSLQNSASTNYYLKIKGITQVNSGGLLEYGTSMSQLPSTSTSVFEFDCTGNVDSGIRVMSGGQFGAWGLEKMHYTLLNTDEAAGQTTLGVVDTTGWGSTDVVCIAPTGTTATQFEKRTMNAVTASTITVTAGLTNAHSGTAPTQAEVGNLTRNMKFRGISASLNGFIYCQVGSTTDLWGCEITNMGSFTTDKRGIDVQTNVHYSMRYCTVYDCTSTGAIGTNVTGSTADFFEISTNVFYNCSGGSISVGSITATTFSMEENIVIGTGATGGLSGISIGDVTGSVTGNRVSGTTSSSGISFSEAGGIITGFSSNITHSNSQSGITINAPMAGGTILNHTSWRNGAYGFAMTTSAEIIVDTLTAFGNVSGGLSASGASFELVNSVFNAGVTNTQPFGLVVTGSSPRININSTTFGATTTHASGDINFSTNGTCGYITMNNCLLSSATEVANQTNMSPSSFIGSEKHDQTSGNNRSFRRYGLITIDTTIFDVTPSMRMTPNNANFKLEAQPFLTTVGASGQTAVITVKVRESVAGDGTDYNGARPRLIVKQNVAAGILVDTVLATASASAEGAFETLTGTTATVSEDCVLEFTVDCDGTTGWVNVDTVNVTSTATDSRGLKYWENGMPVSYGNNGAAGGTAAYTYVG